MPTGDEGASKDGSAATTGTTTSGPAIAGDNSVTIQPIPSDANNMESKARRRFVTTHRRTLDYIQTDSLENKPYPVPDSRPHGGSGLPKAFAQVQGELKSRTGSEWLEIFLPMMKWLKTYQWKNTILQDIIAGCTVGVMVVPQSMSYAKLAGLPVEYGLYSALMPVYAYAFFGSSRQLAVGPVALISLLLSTGLSHELEKQGVTPDNTPNYQERYNTLAIQVSFLVGVMYILLGILR